MKDNVSVHPAECANERVSGRLRLIKQGTTVFMVVEEVLRDLCTSWDLTIVFEINCIIFMWQFLTRFLACLFGFALNNTLYFVDMDSICHRSFRGTWILSCEISRERCA